MEISVEKLLKFPVEYLSEYFHVFIQTAAGRVPTYAVVTATDTPIHGSETHRLDERLWMFLLVSLILGSIFQAVPAGSSDAPTIGITILILCCWVAFSAGAYGFCYLFGGRGDFLTSLSGMLQVLGAVYVASSFGSLLLGVCVKAVAHRDNRYITYFALQFLLLLRYMMIAIKNHHFTGLRRTAVGLVIASAFVALNFVIFFVGLFRVVGKNLQLGT